MPEQHGKIVTQPPELGDNVVVARTIADYAIGSGNISSGSIVVAKLRGYQVNASVPDQSSVSLPHSLGTTPTMFGATMLSHASGYGIIPGVGLRNDSRIVIHLLASGSGQTVPASGLPVNVWCIAP